MKVLVIIPTRKFVETDCLRSVTNQTYTDYSVCMHAMMPIKLHLDPEKDRVMNIVRNRNYIRDMVLKSDAEWFFWVDSDTVVPQNAIETFLKIKEPYMGGWYQKKDKTTWVAGRFNNKGVFVFQKNIPQEEKFETDLLGLGCAFIHRSVLEKISFEHGMDVMMKEESGQKLFYAECAMFCKAAKEKGITPYLIRDVVCGHLLVQT